jgi:hypothetical protein
VHRRAGRLTGLRDQLLRSLDESFEEVLRGLWIGLEVLVVGLVREQQALLVATLENGIRVVVAAGLVPAGPRSQTTSRSSSCSCQVSARHLPWWRLYTGTRVAGR